MSRKYKFKSVCVKYISAVMIFEIIMFYILGISSVDAHCVDIHSHLVSQGIHYVPGPNPCTLCICDKGSPKWCKSVLCSPPSNCKSFEVGNSCCEFKCLDDILNSPDYNDTYDLSLRLIASVVTAVISLSVLFFLIHRLRQRKMRIQENRQLNEEQRCLNSIGYIAGSMGYLPGSIGYLDSTNNDLEFHYDEANVHFPLWKPSGNYFPHGEAPPPYEEAVRAAHAEADAANSHISTNITSLPFITSRNENVNLTLVHNTHVSITSNMQQSNLSTSQSNVLRQYNEQSVQADTQIEPIEAQNQGNSNVSVAIASGPSSSYEQVEVYHDCHSRNSTTIVASSSKFEEPYVQQQGASSESAVINIEDKSSSSSKQSDACVSYSAKGNPSFSCSNSWHKEVSHTSDQMDVVPRDYNKKLAHKSHAMKNEPFYSMSILKSNSDYVSKLKYKNCDINSKDPVKKNNSGKYSDKQETEIGANCIDMTKNNLSYSHGETQPHRTISQKLSKTLKNLETDSYYINFMDYKKSKQIDEDIDDGHKKITSTSKYEKKNYDKPSENLKECTCLYLDPPTMQKGIGMLKSDICAHRTLSKSLRDIDGNLHFTFDHQNKEVSDYIVPRALIKNSESRTEMMKSLRAEQAKHDYHDSLYTNTNTLGRKYMHEEKHTNTMIANPLGMPVTSSSHNEPSKMNTKKSLEKESVDIISEVDECCISDHNQSPAIDDVDDYRSECENCKCLNYEVGKDESLLNETMTLQRRPTDQGEDNSYHKTFLTLPSQIKRSKSVTLNTPRESWFMAMQEMTSSSESD